MDCQECGKEVNIERTKDLAAFFFALAWYPQSKKHLICLLECSGAFFP
jgi:hypothetical protein